MGGNHLLNTDSVLDCRLHGRLDNHQALPVDCTVVEHLIQRDRYLHSALWNETEDTSSVEGSLDTEEHPYCYSSSRDYFRSCKSRASRVSDWTAFDNDDAWTKRSYRQPPCHLSLWGGGNKSAASLALLIGCVRSSETPAAMLSFSYTSADPSVEVGIGRAHV